MYLHSFLLLLLSSSVYLLLFHCLDLSCLFLFCMPSLLGPFSYQIYSMYLIFLHLFYLLLPPITLFFFLYMIEVMVFLLDHDVIMFATHRSHIPHSILLYSLNLRTISSIYRH